MLTRHILIHLDVRPANGHTHPLRLSMEAVELQSEAEVVKGGVEVCKRAVLSTETRLHQLVEVCTLLLVQKHWRTYQSQIKCKVHKGGKGEGERESEGERVRESGRKRERQ